MYSVYENCPVLEGGRITLRLVEPEDCSALLKVYSDPEAQKLFNSDNCNGDDFCYRCEEQMQMAIEFWLFSYKRKYFVRWSILHEGEAVGTLELFRRSSPDEFDGTGVLRLDLRSDLEKKEIIKEILGLILPESREMFDCDFIAVKLPAEGKLRREVFEELGFERSERKLIGHDGTEYGDYFTKRLP